MSIELKIGTRVKLKWVPSEPKDHQKEGRIVGLTEEFFFWKVPGCSCLGYEVKTPLGNFTVCHTSKYKFLGTDFILVEEEKKPLNSLNRFSNLLGG